MVYNGKEVGKTIRTMRKSRGYSFEEMANGIFLSISHVKQVELGHRPLTLDVLYRVMELFQVDANTVLSITGSQQLKKDNIEANLQGLPPLIQAELRETFSYLIDKAKERERGRFYEQAV